MRRTTIKLLFTTMLLMAAGVSLLRAQDPQFTQFFANPLYLAPSYAGASTGHRAVLAYRDQWSVVPGTYRSLSFSYDVNIASLRSGIGVYALGDLAGAGNLGTIITGVVYSYSVAMTSEWSFRPGIGIFYRQMSVNWAKLTFNDQLASGGVVYPTTQQTAGVKAIHDIDISTSILFHSRSAWVGATWDHMLMPKNSFYGDRKSRIPFKFSVFGGYRFIIKSKYRGEIDQSVSVAATARLSGKRQSQLDIGGYWFKAPIMLGVWYRGIPLVKQYAGSDAVAFMIGAKFSRFQIAYSYDLTVSKLGPASGGSHEISLMVEAPIKPRKRRLEAPICPPF